jgi:hypothetical protein
MRHFISSPDIKSRDVDSDSWNPDPITDPDPAFQVNPDPDPIQIQGFDDQKLKKKIQQKIFLYLFLIENCNLLMSKENTQHFKK